MKNRLRPSNKRKLRTRFMLVVGTFSLVLTLSAGILVFLNLNNLSKTRVTATGEEGSGSSLNNGEIITEFTWESDPVTKATLGEDAISASSDAHSMKGGRSSTGGLSAGANGKDIDLEIQGNEMWNQEGIDISIDFSRNSEKSGSFLSRGNGFSFGMEDGYLAVSYRIENKRGGIETVKKKTNYEIPTDPIFRTYRFIYTPLTGKAEIFVNSVIVWNNQHDANTPLSWKNAGNIFIGKGMNGDGKDVAIFDNLVVRTAGNTAPLAETLLNFMLEAKTGGVNIHWSTSANDKIKYFTIERSINGVDFVNIANVASNPENSTGEEYTYFDQNTNGPSLLYYRIRQTFRNGKFVTHALSAIKFQTDKNFAIERVSPTPFDKSFDVSYFIPKSGRVWFQLCDEKGTVIKTESFEAPQGKNVRVIKAEEISKAGIYTLNVIFDNKKVSTKISKI
ncbi:MAG: hypothetical protein IPP51_06845 [Bacteroidetes bacterium]|nr:hypothetical protein [Bacteroidota bacterium]